MLTVGNTSSQGDQGNGRNNADVNVKVRRQQRLTEKCEVQSTILTSRIAINKRSVK